MSKLHVKTGDLVQIMSGRGIDIGKRGKVLEVSQDERKVIVEGLNLATKHVKPRRQGEAGGILKVEAPLYASKVMPVCPKCNKPTRVGHGVDKNGKKVRTCKHADCNGTF